MLYPPRSSCSSFTPVCLCLLETVRVRTCAYRSAFPPCLCDQGDCLSMKVCKRRLAGTEDPSGHPSESTEDRPARRLRADYSVEVFWESAPQHNVSKHLQVQSPESMGRTPKFQQQSSSNGLSKREPRTVSQHNAKPNPFRIDCRAYNSVLGRAIQNFRDHCDL